MKIQSGHKKTLSGKGSAARKDPQFTTQICRLMLVIFMMCLIAGAAWLHIYLHQQIAETGHDIKKVKQEITAVNVELVNLKIQYEQSCSHEYIRKQMARFNMKLNDPVQGQVHRMTVFSPEQARKQALLLEKRQKYTADSRR